MWLFDRKNLLGGLALAALSLTACGFEPVYGPDGVGTRLQGRIALTAPETHNSYLFNRHFETRMGRSVNAPMQLAVTLDTDETDMGGTSTGNTTRYRVSGTATYTLVADKTQLSAGTTDAFTGYSNTGSTVATIAARRDAYARLMVILADQVIDELLLAAPDVPE